MTLPDDKGARCREPGDSAKQRRAEEFLILSLAGRLGAQLKKRKIKLPGGECLEIDGFNESPLILCEAWAHVGPPKSAQKNKVMTDALKLLYVERITARAARKILLFGDKIAARRFQGANWMARALKELGIEIQIAELTDALRDEVVKAQKRQYR